jgi:hypothetical protein
VVTLGNYDLVGLDKFGWFWCPRYRHTFADLEPFSGKCFGVRSGAPDCRLSSPATGRVHRIGTHFSPLFCTRHRTHAFCVRSFFLDRVCCEDTNQKSNQFVKQTAHKVGTPTRRQQTARRRANYSPRGPRPRFRLFYELAPLMSRGKKRG